LEKASGFQAIINNLFWDNGYTQVVSGPTRGDAVLDIHLLRLESSLISCNILPGISVYNGVFLEVGKSKAAQLEAWSGPECSRNLIFPDFMTTAQDGCKVVSLTYRPPLTPENTPGTHFC
jgi:hypothetical protein